MNSTIKKGITACAVIPLFLSSAMAATVGLAPVDWQKDKGNNEAVTIRVAAGLEKGDVELIRQAVKLAADSGKTIVALELDSWGGDGDTGLELAGYVHQQRLKVFVHYNCWSACAYAAMVALGRGDLLVGANGSIGVHQVFDNDTRLANVAWTRRCAGILRKYGAPRELLNAMVETPPSGPTLYKPGELVGMGATVVGEGWTWWLP